MVASVILLLAANLAASDCACVDYQEEILDYMCLPAMMSAGMTDDDIIKESCDGSKEDCVAQGKAKCLAENDCHGVAYNTYERAVMFCTSTEVGQRSWWTTFLKCQETASNPNPKGGHSGQAGQAGQYFVRGTRQFGFGDK